MAIRCIHNMTRVRGQRKFAIDKPRGRRHHNSHGSYDVYYDEVILGR